MTDWGLVIGVLSLAGIAIGAVWAVGQNNGAQKQQIADLKETTAKQAGEIEVMQTQLARGETRFATLTQSIEAMTGAVNEIKGDVKKLLSEPGKRPRRTSEDA